MPQQDEPPEGDDSVPPGLGVDLLVLFCIFGIIGTFVAFLLTA